MSFPDVSDAFWDWTTPVQFILINTVIADFEVAEAEQNAQTFNAVLEPLNPRKLMVKPENQRRWKWWTVWSTFKLQGGQVIQDPEGLQYRIMSVTDWRNGGHLEYEAVQAPDVGMAPPVEGT